MPAFANELSDDQLKALVNYIRQYFGRAPAWHDVEDQLKTIRRETDQTAVTK
jgi:mono/diheme cytochrome c family protein